MEGLELRKKQFAAALATLKAVLELPPSDVVRDAAIQRFEYTFELCWKALRLYLLEVHGVECRSPKGCFREGLAIGMYDAETAEKLLEMVDRRNETTHTYNEKLAERIYNEIDSVYCELLERVLSLLEQGR